MQYIDPHIHMVSRVTDDYETLARMGCVGMSEPAFWAGFDRSSADSFRDYFRQLTDFEPRRAESFGIQHYTWICINAKEAENVRLARDVIGLIPEFLQLPGVLGVGEIGLNKNTRNEAIVFFEQVELAQRLGEQILIHTPHLQDKYMGTRMILDMLADFAQLDRRRVLVDHVEEHTIRGVLEVGLLGRHDAVSGEQVHAAAGRGYGRALWAGAVAGQLGRRLGAIEADGRARFHRGHAPPRPSGIADQADRVRQSRWSFSARAAISACRGQSAATVTTPATTCDAGRFAHVNPNRKRHRTLPHPQVNT